MILKLSICVLAAFGGTANALQGTRRQCFRWAAAVALAPGAARADDALVDAFTMRTKLLRPLPAGTCDAKTPDWLVGDWTVRDPCPLRPSAPTRRKFETQVAASRFEGVKFPQSGALAPKGGFTSNIAGARRGTILALPNAGAAPKNYARSFAPSLGTSSDATNAKSTLQAFWSVVDGGGATDVTVEQKDSTRTIVRYLAPTVKRGVLPQIITADRLACALSSEGPDSLVVTERWAQASVVDDADAALTSLSGTYTAWHRYDRVDGGVRETLRVAAFDDSAAADDDTRPAAVYDYSFFLRRAPAR